MSQPGSPARTWSGEEQFRLLVENILDYAVFTLGADERIDSWNPGAERVFGYTAAEAIGQPGAFLFTPEDRAAGEHERELATARAEGRASDDRWQLRKGGQRFWASGVTSAIRDPSGRLRGYAKVCRDLTEQKQAAEQRERLLAQEKLARLEAERATALRDEFLAVVSHELRTPLTAILLWARLLESGAVADGKERAAAVASIRQSAEAQRQLVGDLLDISRITSGKLRLNVRQADVGVIVRAAVSAVRPMAEARGVAIAVEAAEAAEAAEAGDALSAAVDPDRIQQVVWNLVHNAVKFTDRGGRVTVSVRRVAVGAEGAPHLRLVVSDTGRGIMPEFLPYVFDLFRQGEPAMTRAHGGLGLGLSICRRLVELHGGTIRAESAGPGRGATFAVELPVRGDAHAAAPSPGPAPVGGDPPAPGPAPTAAGWWSTAGGAAASFAPTAVLAGVRVLLVEDEPEARAGLQWLLERWGAEVTAVGSAQLAIKAFRDALRPAAGGAGGAFHVLVSDIAMPESDGYALLGDVRRAERELAAGPGPALPPIPALALTAHAGEKDVARANAAGFQMHLAKPVDPEALIAAVARLAGRDEVA